MLPVEDESALVAPEDFERIPGKLMPELNYIENARPDNAADDGDDSNVEDLVRRHVRIFSFILQDDQCGEKTQRDENAVPVNTQAADVKCDAVHVVIPLC